MTERTITLRTFDSFRKIAPLFEHVQGWQDNPTLSPAWLSALEDTGCASEEAGWIPHHLALYEGAADEKGEGGKLLGVAPAYLKLNSEGEFIFDWGIARAAPKFRVDYYPKLLVAVPFTPATGPRFLVARGASAEIARTAFAAALDSLVERLELSSGHVLFLPGADANALQRFGLLHRHTLQFHWHNRGFHCLEDFLKTLPSKRRTQLRREMRAPAEHGVSIETLQGSAMGPALADTAYELYLTTVEKFYWGRRYLNRAFFEAVTSTMRDRVELVAAKRDGKVIAGAFNLRGDSTLFGRYWGAHAEVPFLHFNVCFYHSIERCIRDGISTFEPGAGGEHKLARGFTPTLTHSVHLVRDPRFAFAVADFFAREREAIELELGRDDAVG